MTCPYIYSPCTECNGKCSAADKRRLSAAEKAARRDLMLWDTCLAIAGGTAVALAIMAFGFGVIEIGKQGGRNWSNYIAANAPV